MIDTHKPIDILKNALVHEEKITINDVNTYRNNIPRPGILDRSTHLNVSKLNSNIPDYTINRMLYDDKMFIDSNLEKYNQSFSGVKIKPYFWMNNDDQITDTWEAIYFDKNYSQVIRGLLSGNATKFSSSTNSYNNIQLGVQFAKENVDSKDMMSEREKVMNGLNRSIYRTHFKFSKPRFDFIQHVGNNQALKFRIIKSLEVYPSDDIRDNFNFEEKYFYMAFDTHPIFTEKIDTTVTIKKDYHDVLMVPELMQPNKTNDTLMHIYESDSEGGNNKINISDTKFEYRSEYYYDNADITESKPYNLILEPYAHTYTVKEKPEIVNLFQDSSEKYNYVTSIKLKDGTYYDFQKRKTVKRATTNILNPGEIIPYNFEGVNLKRLQLQLTPNTGVIDVAWKQNFDNKLLDPYSGSVKLDFDYIGSDEEELIFENFSVISMSKLEKIKEVFIESQKEDAIVVFDTTTLKRLIDEK